jgi:hypothetical protein
MNNIEKIKFNFMDIKRHFSTKENVINEAEKLILSGIRKNNKIYINNGINILGKFISNSKVKETIKLVDKIIKGDVLSYDLIPGQTYDRNLLEQQGYQFGWESTDKAVIWEADGDGWFAEKQPDGTYKVVKQYYEGTEEMKERQKKLLSNSKNTKKDN